MEKPAVQVKSLIPFFIINVLINLTANFAHPVTPTLIQELQLSDYMFGVSMAVMQIANFLFSPFWGKLNNYISSRKTLLFCCSGYAIGQLWFGCAKTELMIIGARMFAGIFIGGIFVSILTYIINCSTSKTQGANLTISATISSVASAFGYTVGGFIGEISIHLAFYVQAACLFGCGLLCFFVCKDDSNTDIHSMDRKTFIKQTNPFACLLAGRLFMTVTFFILFLVLMLQNFGATAYDQCFNYYIKDQFGFSSSYNGLLKGAMGMIALIANSTICLWIIHHTNPQNSIIAVLGTCSLITIGVMFSDHAIPFIIFNIIFFGFNAVTVPLLQHMVASRARGKDSNLIMGFYNSIKSLGSIFGSLTAGVIYGYGVKLPFIVAGSAFLLASIAASYLALRNRAPKTAHSKA